MDKLISVVRRPRQLVALISQPKHQFKFPLGNNEGNSDGQLNSFYQIVTMPLSQVPDSLYANKDRLLAAWNSLQNVRVLDEESLYQILVVLIATQPDFDADSVMLPPLRIDIKVDPQKVSKKVASLERERTPGKHYRAAKVKQTTAIDLRGYLCESRYCSLLLSRLRNFLPMALAKLARDGYESEALSAAYQNGNHSFDPYLAYQHNVNDRSLRDPLPSSFSSKILPLLKGSEWTEVMQFLKVFWGLSLDRDQHLLMVISRLLCFSKNRVNTLQWCRIIARQPLNRRAIFTTLLIKSGAYTLDAGEIDATLIDRFNGITPRAKYSSRLYKLLRSFKRGINSDYLLAGFQLTDKYCRGRSIFRIYNGAAFNYTAVTELLDHLRKPRKNRYNHPYAMAIWECFGELPGFDQVINKLPWRKLPKEVTENCLGMFSSYRTHNDRDHTFIDKWQIFLQYIGSTFEYLLVMNKDYQEKFIEGIEYYFMYWYSAEKLRKYIDSFYALLKRVCQPPFKKWVETGRIIRHFVACKNETWREKLLTAPDEIFLTLEKAIRKQNTANLINNGIWAMMEVIPCLGAQAFLMATKSFLDVTQLLGTLKKVYRFILLKKFKKEIYQGNDEKEITDKDEAERVITRLREFVLNELIGHHRLSLDPDKIFALQMSSVIDCNQQAFKRFLKAHFQGQSDYLKSHPLTVNWIKQRKQLDIDLWTRGIKHSVQTASHGLINLAIETEPLEVLKMGEYVGSCLGLGGIYSCSAVANVLDINKQVIYARNEKNRVIARQLLAISKEGKLVCFNVYPEEIDNEIKTLFRNYDLEFAKLLGLEIFKNEKNAEYDIDDILAETWYDDGNWDLTL